MSSIKLNCRSFHRELQQEELLQCWCKIQLRWEVAWEGCVLYHSIAWWRISFLQYHSLGPMPFRLQKSQISKWNLEVKAAPRARHAALQCLGAAFHRWAPSLPDVHFPSWPTPAFLCLASLLARPPYESQSSKTKCDFDTNTKEATAIYKKIMGPLLPSQ